MLLVCLVTNSRTLMIFKIGVLKISQYSQENTSINLATVLKVCNFFIQRLQLGCYLVNIAKFLRTLTFIKHLRWLLLPCPRCICISLLHKEILYHRHFPNTLVTIKCPQSSDNLENKGKCYSIRERCKLKLLEAHFIFTSCRHKGKLTYLGNEPRR